MSAVEQFLETYGNALDELNNLRIDIGICEDSLTRMTASYESDGSKSGALPGDNRNASLARLADLRNKEKKLLERAEKSRDDIRQFLDGIDSYNQRTVLQLRYCDRKTVNEIIKLTNYSRQSVYNYMNAGMLEAEMLYRQRRWAGM